MLTSFSRSAENAPTFSVVSDVYRILASAKETGGALGLIDAIVPPGGGPPPHTHTREDEFFYVLEGEITFYVESPDVKAPTVARPGAFVFAPRNQKHRFRNETTKPARMLFGVLPGGMEGLFADAGTQVATGSTIAGPVSEPDLIRLAQLAAQNYGCHIDPPSK